MDKEVMITVVGKQTADGKTDTVEVISVGRYYKRKGNHYILYEGIDEENGTATKNKVKIYKDIVDVTTSGITTSHMVFEEKKKNYSYYGTPFGKMQMGVYTRSINKKQSFNRFTVRIDYMLEINFEFASDNTITIDVEGKQAADLRLL